MTGKERLDLANPPDGSHLSITVAAFAAAIALIEARAFAAAISLRSIAAGSIPTGHRS